MAEGSGFEVRGLSWNLRITQIRVRNSQRFARGLSAPNCARLMSISACSKGVADGNHNLI